MARRLQRELRAMQHTQGDDDHNQIALWPDEQNLFQWRGRLKGPQGTPYEGGTFLIGLQCSATYPLTPPHVWMITRCFHPNIHFHTGEICLDILKDEWTPAWTLHSVCRAILALLSLPEADHPLNCDAGNLLRSGDHRGFASLAAMYTKLLARSYIVAELPPPPDLPESGLHVHVWSEQECILDKISKDKECTVRVVFKDATLAQRLEGKHITFEVPAFTAGEPPEWHSQQLRPPLASRSTERMIPPAQAQLAPPPLPVVDVGSGDLSSFAEQLAQLSGFAMSAGSLGALDAAIAGSPGDQPLRCRVSLNYPIEDPTAPSRYIFKRKCRECVNRFKDPYTLSMLKARQADVPVICGGSFTFRCNIMCGGKQLYHWFDEPRQRKAEPLFVNISLFVPMGGVGEDEIRGFSNVFHVLARADKAVAGEIAPGRGTKRRKADLYHVLRDEPTFRAETVLPELSLEITQAAYLALGSLEAGQLMDEAIARFGFAYMEALNGLRGNQEIVVMDPTQSKLLLRTSESWRPPEHLLMALTPTTRLAFIPVARSSVAELDPTSSHHAWGLLLYLRDFSLNPGDIPRPHTLLFDATSADERPAQFIHAGLSSFLGDIVYGRFNPAGRLNDLDSGLYMLLVTKIIIEEVVTGGRSCHEAFERMNRLSPDYLQAERLTLEALIQKYRAQAPVPVGPPPIKAESPAPASDLALDSQAIITFLFEEIARLQRRRPSLRVFANISGFAPGVLLDKDVFEIDGQATLAAVDGSVETTTLVFGRRPSALEVATRPEPPVRVDINDQRVSKPHASICFMNKDYFLKDEGSLRGTFVRVTKETLLQDGDIIRVGPAEFEVALQRPTATSSFLTVGDETIVTMNALVGNMTSSDRTVASSGPAQAALILRLRNPRELSPVSEQRSSLNPGLRVFFCSPATAMRPELATNFPVTTEGIILGRVVHSDTRPTDTIIMIESSEVSKRHAMIEYKLHGFYLRDEGSKNGTYLRLEREKVAQSRRRYRLTTETIVNIAGVVEFSLLPQP